MKEPEIYEVLREMNIVERYLSLAKNHQIPIKELFKKYDNQRVIEIIETLGYNAKYVKSENFFKISFDDCMEARFQINLILKSGIVDIVFCTWWKDEVLTGVPMSLLVKEVSEDEIETKKPLFRNYDELIEILREVFVLYEDYYSRVKSKLSV